MNEPLTTASGRNAEGNGSSAVPAVAWFVRHGALLAVMVVLLLAALVRLRVADVPLERDEGEYALAGQLILQGIPPYKLVYTMKFPGTFYAYAVIMAAFGATPWGIHAGLLVVNAATVILLFLLGRRLIGDFGAAIGACTFTVLTLDRFMMGIFAHANHFVVLALVGSLLLLLRSLDTRRPGAWLGTGALLGIAVLMKQHAILFVPFVVAFAFWSERRSGTESRRTLALHAGLLLAGTAAPIAAVCAMLAMQGVFAPFWFWTVQYASAYVSEVPLSEAWTRFVDVWRHITHLNFPVWLIGIAGAFAIGISRWDARLKVLLSGLAVASLLAICPGFYFRHHYFLLLLPAVALLAGVALTSLAGALERRFSPPVARILAAGVFVVATGSYALKEFDYLVSIDPDSLSRSVYAVSPFVEAPELGRFLREHTSAEDRIAILGSEPEILFYARRKGATGYIYTYGIVERQPFARRMLDEMVREVESASAKYLVVVDDYPSWADDPASDRAIFDWAEAYTRKCYALAGLTDIALEGTIWRWGEDLEGYEPRSGTKLYVFERIAGGPCSALPLMATPSNDRPRARFTP